MTDQLHLALSGVPDPIPRARTQTSYAAAVAQVPKRQRRRAAAWTAEHAARASATVDLVALAARAVKVDK